MAFEIISLTQNAANRIKEIMSSSDDVLGIRIGIKDAGCVGVSYTIDKVTSLHEGDDHIKSHGVDVYINPTATMYLLGTVMDFETEKMGAKFTFNNPNQSDECGCGQSVQLKAADLKNYKK